uniref:Uncharacterized protein n=1 Tax=Candidatus Kentrum sp. FW TaxID=2126338 RepID=A0A450TVZ9_9GAMM|nr:MAG: hypothetical protein BECKFW1821C_GA0114237_104620 [Candidatus Kentron sp. FW]
MPIHYAPHGNHLTSDPNDYAAQVRVTGPADIHAIRRRPLHGEAL